MADLLLSWEASPTLGANQYGVGWAVWKAGTASEVSSAPLVTWLGQTIFNPTAIIPFSCKWSDWPHALFDPAKPFFYPTVPAVLEPGDVVSAFVEANIFHLGRSSPSCGQFSNPVWIPVQGQQPPQLWTADLAVNSPWQTILPPVNVVLSIA